VFTGVIVGEGIKGVKATLLTALFVGISFLLVSCVSPPVSTEPQSLLLETEQPTPIRFEGHATPILLPRTNLYIFLTSSRPLYYRDGTYFQYFRENWYKADDLKGPWQRVDVVEIPDLLRSVPPDYYYNNFPYKIERER
jgi:hypothetical protein